MLDSQLRALANKHRRRLLVALLEKNPQEDVSIPEGVHMGESELEDLRVELFHTHLPMLEEAGFIRWDRDAHEVVKGPNFDELRPLLKLIDDHADELPEDWL